MPMRAKPENFMTPEVEKRVEELLSEAMTDTGAPTYKEYGQKSRVGKAVEDFGDYLMREADIDLEKRLGRKTPKKFVHGGKVHERAGDVRYNRNRGKTY